MIHGTGECNIKTTYYKNHNCYIVLETARYWETWSMSVGKAHADDDDCTW